jgi:hypothetical protein
MREGLLVEIKKGMQPLVDRFGLRIAKEGDSPDFAEAIYTNETTGLSVAVDWTEFRPFVKLYELTAGALPPDLDPGSTSQRLRAFDADDLLALRAAAKSPAGKMLGERDNYAAGRLVGQYAAVLEQVAGDVLNGDFTIFEELDRVVKARARQMNRRA